MFLIAEMSETMDQSLWERICHLELRSENNIHPEDGEHGILHPKDSGATGEQVVKFNWEWGWDISYSRLCRNRLLEWIIRHDCVKWWSISHSQWPQSMKPLWDEGSILVLYDMNWPMKENLQKAVNRITYLSLALLDISPLILKSSHFCWMTLLGMMELLQCLTRDLDHLHEWAEGDGEIWAIT